LSAAGPAAPEKSAVAIVVARGTRGEALALVGRRSSSSRFLGGFYAFPGGVVEEADGDPGAGEDRCLRRTAARELAEETGVRVEPERFLPAGRRVTPPFSLRRFDSVMYLAELPRPAPLRGSGELEALEWADPAVLHERWRNLEIRVAPPLIPILEALSRTSGAGESEIAAELRRVNEEMEADGPRIEFVPDVLMIPVATPTLPPATHTNCYLVGSAGFAIVDPGSDDPQELARLSRHVARRRAAARAPGMIILTHHHADHVGGALSLSRELSVPILAHPATWERWGEGAFVPGERRIEVREGEEISLSGGETFRVHHTPGHAEGHIALYEIRQGSLFAGDLVSGVSTILVGPDSGDLDRYLSSLERIRNLGARTLFPAHGPPLISPSRAVQATLDHRADREKKIVAALAGGPKALENLARLAYEDTPGAAPELAARQAASHLDRLSRQGRVRREGERWRLVS
jgi:glyoxylase-like metal-dependent hydrolase (beta-lactamase superfamily II)/8-oxo-dGTP pyrophosphatase MutT (NUDIX family)